MINGNNVFIKIIENGEEKIVAGTKVNEIQTDCETIEISGPNTGAWREQIAGRMQWSFSSGYLVTDVDRISDLLKTRMKVGIIIASRENGAVRKKLYGNAIIKQCKQSFAKAKLAQGSFSFVGSGPLSPFVEVQSISLSPQSLTIMQGNYDTVVPTIYPSNATEKSVAWSSSDPSVATVDQNGNVTAVGGGSCTITCAALDGSGVTATCGCVVTLPVLVQEITLTASSISVIVNNIVPKEDAVSAIVSPDNATYKQVTWTSNSENLIVVQNGDDYTIQAIAAGTYRLIATAQDGSGVSASCYVFAE